MSNRPLTPTRSSPGGNGSGHIDRRRAVKGPAGGADLLPDAVGLCRPAAHGGVPVVRRHYVHLGRAPSPGDDVTEPTVGSELRGVVTAGGRER
jgi:hypothetical protein